MRTACLNSSLADIWQLAGGSVGITVAEAVERGFASPDAILVDNASGRSINAEILVASQPDLVLGSVDTASHLRLKPLLDDLGIGMLLISQDSFEEFLSAFRILTAITGRDDLFAAFGEGQSEAIASSMERAALHPSKPRVLFVRAGSAFSSVRAKRAEDHFAAGILEDLGAVNIADEMETLTESLSLEAIIASDPDMILIVFQGDEEAGEEYIESLFSKPGWRDVEAVVEGRVHFLPKDLFHYKPNGRWAEAYAFMEGILYDE